MLAQRLALRAPARTLLQRRAYHIPTAERRATSASPSMAWMGAVAGASGMTWALCMVLRSVDGGR
jgi:hypothetical protein